MTPALWSGIGRGNLIVEEFDGEFILYNRLSGETHVLNRESKLIVDAIFAHPCTLEDVRTALPDVDMERIERHLAILEQWGIATSAG